MVRTFAFCIPVLAPMLIGADNDVAIPRNLEPTGSATSAPFRSWLAPAVVTVTADRPGLREEERIGSYGQPRWTARRRFTETRSYVIPEGQFQFEYWYQVRDKRGDEPSTIKQIYEIEAGLPYRLQLDLYQVWEKEGQTGDNRLAENSAEVRWALADWGVIPANPTLYGEYKFVNGGYDVAEFKILLSDELAERWHWAANLVYERELGGEETVSKELIGALSYTVFDEKLSVGGEIKATWEDVSGNRGDYGRDVLIGPCIQWRPVPQSHINLAYLANTTSREESDNAGRLTAIFGWEF